MSEDALRNLLIEIVRRRGHIDFAANTKLLIDAVYRYNELIAPIDRSLLIKSEDFSGGL